MKGQWTIALAALLLAACARPLEFPTQSTPLAPAVGPAAQPSGDPSPTALHPDATPRTEQAFERGASRASEMSLAGFAERYREAGSPKVAILFNRQFSSQLTSWTMESKDIFQEVRSGGGAETAIVEGPGGRARVEVAGGGLEVSRSESFQEYENPRGREGFSSEYVEWKFREAFSNPFFSAGVNLVDSDLAVQGANRSEDADTRRQRISDVNANLSALKDKTDWIIEVLMVPDSRALAGYLFRAEAKEIESGTVLASVMTHLDEFRDRPVRRTISAVPGGYRIREEDLPVPRLEEYAEDLAIRLLSELNRRIE